MTQYKCQMKYFGYKSSEEYREHCAFRERNATSQSARDYWRGLKEKGSVY